MVNDESVEYCKAHIYHQWSMYRMGFFGTPISFSCNFYIDKYIDMRSFVTSSGHQVIFLYFFPYCTIIFRDGTTDTKRGTFQVTGCLNVITLSHNTS